VSPGRAGVLFDVDGTLVDTNYLHAIAWSRALRDHGEWAPMHAIHRLIGMGGERLLRSLLGHDSEPIRRRRAEHFRALYDDVRPFPGADDLLSQTRRHGLAAVVASSSPRDELDFMLQLLDGPERIDASTSADDVTTSKPAPDVLDKALEVGDLDRRWALLVGDTIWDVQAARAAGIACVALESGGFSRHELHEEGAVRVYRDARELADQFETSPLAGLVR
jgi:HAD superfamily hydrolase (TIGR01549 family)